MAEPAPEVLETALQIEDFRRAYELPPSLGEVLKEAGIEEGIEERGMEPEEWSQFGAVIKTMEEFEEAYITFREKVADFACSVKAR